MYKIDFFGKMLLLLRFKKLYFTSVQIFFGFKKLKFYVFKNAGYFKLVVVYWINIFILFVMKSSIGYSPIYLMIALIFCPFFTLRLNSFARCKGNSLL